MDMKTFRKLGLALSLVCASMSLASCSQKEEKTKIGILQLLTHGALDSAKEGFVDGLASAGYVDGENITITYQNPEADESSMSTMSRSLVRDNEFVLGIATPAAVALQAAAKSQNSDCKILFTAVTDAVDAKLVASNEAPGGNITGTSDINPVKEQIELIKELLPNATSIGIVYTISETNSKVQADLAEAQIKAMGLNATIATISDATEITSVTRQLISKGIDAIYIPTDNTLASNMPALTNVAYESKIPVVCGEPNMVTAGGTITLGIDYYRLGQQTATMLVDMLKNGKTPATMAVQTQSLADCELTVNEAALTKIGLTLPSSIRDRLS